MRKSWSLTTVLCAAALVAAASTAMAAFDEVEWREGELPPAARPGECWCVVTLPAVYKTVSEQVMVEGPQCRYETIPAAYETRSERVCVKKECKKKVKIPAVYREECYQDCVKKECSKTVKIPAVYEEREESVICKKERKKKVKIPAVYREESYQVEACPARTEWRKVDCGAQVTADRREEKGECYCLVTIPAKFETRTRRVCVSKESCSYEIIPAEYKTVKRKVCVQKERKVKEVVPARYETRSREVCVTPARKVWRRTSCSVPASFETSAPVRVEVEKKGCSSCSEEGRRNWLNDHPK